MDGGCFGRVRSFQHDDGLGCWRIDLCSPRADLADCVAHLWYGEGWVAYRRDRILPSSGSYLLINLGPRQYRIVDGNPPRRIAFDDVWYSGIHQSPIDTEAPHGNALLGVAFHAHGARPWLRVDAADCADRIVPLADLLGDGVLALRERLLQCATSDARFDLVERWIAARRSPRHDASPLVRWAGAAIETRGGALPIVELAREAGVSRKHLAERFRREVGVTPKGFARLHRFRRALRLLSERAPQSWSEFAVDCGFYDQSHLIRDFQAFCGMAPLDFVRCARPDSDSVVVR